MFTATDSQVEEWKKKHGGVYAFTSEDGESQCYLRQATRKDLSHCQIVAGVDPYKYNETLIRNCWLGGDEDMQLNEAKFLGLSAKVEDVIEIIECEVKKL